MNNLYQQLMYNWERGFYSVVRNKEGEFIIFSTKDYDGDLRRSYPQESLEEAMKYIGSDTGYSKIGLEQEVMLEGLYLVDTIHPSELMGKGFQVGDKVGFNINRLKGKTGLIVGKNEGTMPASYNILIGDDSEWLLGQYLKPVLPSGSDNQTVKEILTVQGEEKKEVDQLGNKLKQPIELDDNLVENSVNVDFDSGKPTARVGFLNGKYISIGERDVESRSHICNCGFWDSEKKWGETVYTQQFGDRCVSMSVTNNYVICSKCGQKLRRVAISYLDN